MLYIVFLPLAVGAMSVLQNTLNKRVAETMGLPLALVVNNLVLLTLSISFFLIVRLMPMGDLPEMLRPKTDYSLWHIRNVWPGVFGFLIIAALPLAIERAGALKVFLGVVVAQLVASLLWDYFLESMPLSVPRVLGAVLAMIGAVLATR